MKSIAYLGIGSNLGNRAAHLFECVSRLENKGLFIHRISSLYESAPVGPVQRQPSFYNAVLQVETKQTPEELLAQCQMVEQEMGRRRWIAKGPRNIDVDILLMGEEIMDEKNLTIPHPELLNRAFVLVPLLEIAALLTDPRNQKLLCYYLEAVLQKQSIVQIGAFPSMSGIKVGTRRLSPLTRAATATE